MLKRLYRYCYFGQRTPAPWWKQFLFRLGMIGGRR